MKVLVGDCLEVLPSLPAGCANLVFADLPYGVTRNPWDCEIDLDRLFPELWRVLAPRGVIVMTAQQPFTSTLVAHQRASFRYDLIWNKVLVSGHLNANRQPLRCHESVLVFSKEQGTYNPQKWLGESKNHSKKIRAASTTTNYGKFDEVDNSETLGMWKHPRSILTFHKPHPSVAVHPTQKPVELLRWIIRTYTNPGELIIDPTAGSGTTGEAALLEGRDALLIEQDAQYAQAARQRLEARSVQRMLTEVTHEI